MENPKIEVSKLDEPGFLTAFRFDKDRYDSIHFEEGWDGVCEVIHEDVKKGKERVRAQMQALKDAERTNAGQQSGDYIRRHREQYERDYRVTLRMLNAIDDAFCDRLEKIPTEELTPAEAAKRLPEMTEGKKVIKQDGDRLYFGLDFYADEVMLSENFLGSNRRIYFLPVLPYDRPDQGLDNRRVYVTDAYQELYRIVRFDYELETVSEVIVYDQKDKRFERWHPNLDESEFFGTKEYERLIKEVKLSLSWQLPQEQLPNAKWPEWLFIGDYPEVIRFADRRFEDDGDYRTVFDYRKRYKDMVWRIDEAEASKEYKAVWDQVAQDYDVVLPEESTEKPKSKPQTDEYRSKLEKLRAYMQSRGWSNALAVDIANQDKESIVKNYEQGLDSFKDIKDFLTTAWMRQLVDRNWADEVMAEIKKIIDSRPYQVGDIVKSIPTYPSGDFLGKVESIKTTGKYTEVVVTNKEGISARGDITDFTRIRGNYEPILMYELGISEKQAQNLLDFMRGYMDATHQNFSDLGYDEFVQLSRQARQDLKELTSTPQGAEYGRAVTREIYMGTLDPLTEAITALKTALEFADEEDQPTISEAIEALEVAQEFE